MHPVLFHFKVPADWATLFGPKSAIFGRWQLLLVALIIGASMLMWATDPERAKERRLYAWLGGIITLAAGLPLAGVGLVKLGEVKLHTYGVMISMGFLVGITLAAREARRAGHDPEKILDVSFWILIAAIAGSRILYILTTWQEYENDLGKLLRVWEGGLVFYGGLIGAVLASIWYVRKHNLSFWVIADFCIPSVALGQAFGRIGCFSAGCCYGKHLDASWAVQFTTGLATRGLPLHPTQLYEAFGNLMIFFLLLAIRSRKRYHGQALVWYLFLYPVVRFTVELFRGDKIRGYLFEMDLLNKIPGPDILTTSQIVSILLFALGLGCMTWLNRQYEKNQKLGRV